MRELPMVTDSFFLGPDIAFDGDKERGFEVWRADKQFYWTEVDKEGNIISVILGPFPSSRWAHRDALLALSAREKRDASRL
jgi:hypothetical protein